MKKEQETVIEADAIGVNMFDTPAPVAINNSADKVAQALNKLVDAGEITEQDKGLVLWFHKHCKDMGFSLAEAGRTIRYNSATVSRLFNGNYEGSLTNVIKQIKSYKHLTDERAMMAQDEFVETSIWNTVRLTCLLAFRRHAPVRIIGVSQIGKTSALLEYKRRSEWRCIYVRIPAAPSFRTVVEAVSEAVGVTIHNNVDALRKRVISALDENTLLIIDELHELAISSSTAVAMKSMEWIREIYDRTKCGLVVCGTRTMEDDLLRGKIAGWLDQFNQRCIKVTELPVRLPDSDFDKTFKAYGFPVPDGDTLAVIRNMRMNRLTTSLKMASDLASEKGLEKTLELFVKTVHTAFGKEVFK